MKRKTLYWILGIVAGVVVISCGIAYFVIGFWQDQFSQAMQAK